MGCTSSHNAVGITPIAPHFAAIDAPPTFDCPWKEDLKSKILLTVGGDHLVADLLISSFINAISVAHE